ncbi:MAG TPA: HupE/UreJ family protein [Vicinamibacterales bacterium]|nr:HupE/UreJ family protein [Vicinamibacterales bacterium]
MIAAAALAALLTAGLQAHEIPADVTAHALVRPDGTRLQIIVRVPLAALRDVEWPLTGAGFLRLDEAGLDTLIRDAAVTWIASELRVFEDGAPLPVLAVAATRLSLPSDRSLTSWDDALAHVTGPPLPSGTQIIWNQSLVDVLLEAPIASDRSEFSLEPGFARLGLRVVTVLRFFLPDGRVRAFEYTGDPGLVRLDPSWSQAALRFVRLGFDHILSGADHLLFLLCLVLPFRRIGQLIVIVTAFTVAHSITMAAAALGHAPGMLWFPPLIETLIALSILYMAIENILGASSVRRRWIITCAFGLVHGFGFSFALRESLQFAGSHLVTSLVAFNVGVELGQILVLAVLVPALGLLVGRVVAERMAIIVISAVVAHTAWHWMAGRWAVLGEYDLWSDRAFWLLVVRTALVAVGIWALWWAAGLRKRKGPADAGPSA